MAGVEIDVDSDEFQEWYRAFTTFPSQAISEAQHQINTTVTVIRLLASMSRAEIEPIARNRGTTTVQSVGGT